MPCAHPHYAQRNGPQGRECTVCWTVIGPNIPAKPDPAGPERAERDRQAARLGDRLAHRPHWTGD